MLRVANLNYQHVKPGESAITVYQKIESGVERMVKTYYRPIERGES